MVHLVYMKNSIVSVLPRLYEFSLTGNVSSIIGQEDFLTLSLRRPLSYRNQSFDLLCKSMDWFLYNSSLHHERVKTDRMTFNDKDNAMNYSTVFSGYDTFR